MARRVSGVIACIFLLCTIGLSQQQHDPLTEGEVIHLLEGGVPQERVAKLAQERGIAFDITPTVERDLREAGATDSLLQTLREVAAKGAGAKTPGNSPKTNSPGASTGILLITSDAACKLSVDGDDAGELNPNGSKLTNVAYGEHMIQAISTEDPTVKVEWTGRVASPAQKLVELGLQEKVRSAREGREKAAADAAGNKRMQSFLGTWKNVVIDRYNPKKQCNHIITYTLEFRPEDQSGYTLEGDWTLDSKIVLATNPEEVCRSKYFTPTTGRARATLARILTGKDYLLILHYPDGHDVQEPIRLVSPSQIDLLDWNPSLLLNKVNP